MSGPEFFQTRMGAKFFEGTLPNLVDVLGKLQQSVADATTAMHRLAEALESSNAQEDDDLSMELPCCECGEQEAIVALPWQRETKVCAECWAEITDGSPIADVDRIHRLPEAKPDEG
jgi:hypothetical protein